MSEGRRTRVQLLDGRRLEIVVQPRLRTDDLLEIVASHCRLRRPDTEYFGLAFYDASEQLHWLQREGDRRVLEHEFPPKLLAAPVLTLYHLVKFFVENVERMAHATSVELYFLQVRSMFLEGGVHLLDVDFHQAVALLLHVHHGDFFSGEMALCHLHKLNLTPRAFLKLVSFSDDYELKILEEYRALEGTARGDAVLRFLEVCQRSATYGMRFYHVTDKPGAAWLAGCSARGVFQFDPTDISRPKKIFHWRQLENLYYRDRKFSLEVHDAKRVMHELSSFNMYEEALRDRCRDEITCAVADPSTQVSVSRRALMPSSVHVHTFVCDTALVCKALWSFAVAQHTFYLDTRSISKLSGAAAVRSDAAALATQLTRAMESNSSLGSQPAGARSLTDAASMKSDASQPSLRSARSEDERKRDIELYKDLKQKKKSLEAMLTSLLQELRKTCIHEGEVTGTLPKEIHRCLAPGEPLPKIKRRVGTSFSLSNTIFNTPRSDRIASLEADLEVQRKIVAAATKLAYDKSTNKSVRKKRQRDLQDVLKRQRDLQGQLAFLKSRASQPDLYGRIQSDWPQSFDLQRRGTLPTLASPPSSSAMAMASAPVTPGGSMADVRSGSSDASQQDSDGMITEFVAAGCAGGKRGRSPKHAESTLSLPMSPPSRRKQSMPPLSPSTSFAAMPLYENVGYSGRRTAYCSSYRQSNFPTLVPSNSPSVERIAANHRTHSEHSLQSVCTDASGAAAPDPLPDYRTSGDAAGRHPHGAYNLPRQRTSWRPEVFAASHTGVPPQWICGASTDEHSSRIHESNLPGFSAPGETETSNYSGSLDRRIIKARQRMIEQREQAQRQLTERHAATSPVLRRLPPKPPSAATLLNAAAAQYIDTLPRKNSEPQVSPRCTDGSGVAVSVSFSGSTAVETSKSLQTTDVIRYHSRLVSSPKVSPAACGSGAQLWPMGGGGDASLRPLSPLVAAASPELSRRHAHAPPAYSMLRNSESPKKVKQATVV